MSRSDKPGQTMAVDLGKTSCRLRVTLTETSPVEHQGPGAPGLADGSGLDAAFHAICGVVDLLDTRIIAQSSSLAIGAAGVESDRDAAERLARRLRDRFALPVVIASDIVTAHIGALSGCQGTVLVAGTGAVAYGINAAGYATRSDGWGPWLGDEGSGRWIGQHGLSAALRALDGRGPHTSLNTAALALGVDAAALPRLIAADAQPAQRLAAFAPIMLSHAASGDVIAAEIVDEATTLLSATAAAARVGNDIHVLGGLVANAYFRERLTRALDTYALTLISPPDGDALAGALLLAQRTDLPHERYAIRV